MNNILLVLSFAIIAGLLASRGARALKLPNVTAFLIAGLIIGPSILGLINESSVVSLNIISSVALGFIAFSIGGEFKLSNLKSIGKAPVTITVFQGLTTALFLVIGLIALGFAFPSVFGDSSHIIPQALILGAIGLATAPAATLMVVRQYKADGPVTRILLPVVAMDDALGLVVFSVLSALASSFMGGEITFSGMVLKPLYEIVGSLLIGSIIGFIASIASRFFASRGNNLAIAIASVFLGVGLCEQFGFSSLLVCMMIGAIMVNLCRKSNIIFEQTDRFTPPLFLLFFVMSGADLNLSVLPAVGILGVVYIIVRVVGKCVGAMLGAVVEKCDSNIKKYLGLMLLPQAGVAIGMARLASSQFPEFGSRINAIVLAATLVYELIGPMLTKLALVKAGEIKQ